MIPGFMLSASTEGKPPGWSNPSDWREMIADPATRVGRPRQVYVGAEARDYVALQQR